MKTALLCVSFGTSVPAARKSITAVEDALRKELPQADFFHAYTSKTIRRRLSEQGETVWSMDEALEKLTDGSFDRIVIQPTHFLYGLEYENLRASVQAARIHFPEITLGIPLLSHIRDLQALAEILSEEYPREANNCLLLMGHGTPHFSDVVYPAMQTVFHTMGRNDVFVVTVDGWQDITEVIPQLKKQHFTSARTVPMMLVAGDHALNDMAGDQPDSWKSCLTREGFRVECVMQGLGMNPGVQQMYRQHLRGIL